MSNQLCKTFNGHDDGNGDGGDDDMIKLRMNEEFRSQVEMGNRGEREREREREM